MKKILMATVAAMSIMGANAQDITLPQPDLKQKSMSVVEALATRHSVREYSDKQLTLQEMSNLCWAACGVSRDKDHRTSPTAMNRKEIRLYVFNNEGVYEYLAIDNILKKVADGDNRTLLAGGKGFSQDFVKTAPVSLLMVIDYDRFGQKNERSMAMTCADAGYVSENINLYCQAVGLATVPRATMDTEAISKLLGFTENQVPILNNTVGFEKR